jgi:hypothetical protein
VKRAVDAVTEDPSGVVTVMFTVPVPGGAVAVIDVDEFIVTAVAVTFPNITTVPCTKPVPVIVTGVPPAILPAVVDMPVTVSGVM